MASLPVGLLSSVYGVGLRGLWFARHEGQCRLEGHVSPLTLLDTSSRRRLFRTARSFWATTLAAALSAFDRGLM